MRTLMLALTMLCAAATLSAQSIHDLYSTKEEACTVTDSYNYRNTNGYNIYGQIGWEREVEWRPIQYLDRYELEHRTYSVNSFLYCQVVLGDRVLDDCEIVAIDSRNLVVGNQCPEPKPLKATVDDVAIMAIFGETPGEEIRFKVVVGSGTAEDPLIEYWAEETHSFVPNGTTGLLDIDNDGRLDTWSPVVLHLNPYDIATISSLGYATFSPRSRVTIPAEVDVFTVAIDEAHGRAVLHPLPTGTVLAPGTGYVIRAEEGSYSFPVTGNAIDAIGDNALQVSDGILLVGESDFIYALGERSDGTVGFMRVNVGVLIPKGKAYLRLSAGSKISFLGIYDEDPTTIASPHADKSDNAYYSLQGVKTATPSKGLYIVKGKKVIISH